MTTHPTIPSGQLKGLGLLAEALTYPDTGETIQLITAEDGSKWFWLHEVAKVATLPNLNTTYRRSLDEDEWRTIEVSAGQPTSTNSRYGVTSPNAKRILLSLPGTLKALTIARKNTRARAFDRWARHEVLAPLLVSGTEGGASGAAVTGCAHGDYIESMLALGFETNARIAAVQERQTEILDRLTTEPPRGPRTARDPARRTLPRQSTRTPEAAEMLESWRNRHLLSPEVWAVAAYALPILLEHGDLQASPKRIAERTGLDQGTVNRALLDLVVAGLLRPVGETSRARHTAYTLGHR
jgi:DNA-binding MarR family transcriptional regulator